MVTRVCPAHRGPLAPALATAFRYGLAWARVTLWPNPHGLKPANQQLALIHHLRRQMIVQFDEQLFVADHFAAPRGSVEGLHFVEFFLRIIEALPIDILV